MKSKNKKIAKKRKIASIISILAVMACQLMLLAVPSYAVDEKAAFDYIQSEIPGGEYSEETAEKNGVSISARGVTWEEGNSALLSYILGPFDSSEADKVRSAFIDYGQSLGENAVQGNVTSFQGYKVIEFVQNRDGQEVAIEWYIEYENYVLYNYSVGEPGAQLPAGYLRSRIEQVSTVALKAMAQQGQLPSEKAGQEGDLNLEEIAGKDGAETTESKPDDILEAGVSVPGTTEYGSKYEPNSSGDIFEGGVWNSSKGESDFLERRFDSPTTVSEIRIGRAGTDVTTENSSLTMKLQTVDGSWITVDGLQNTNINYDSLTGGAAANSIPSYTKVFDEPVEAIAFRIEFTGHGWFVAEDIEIISGSAAASGEQLAVGPAGIGDVGNIPGPETTSEAVAGVVVPGIIATALGSLIGMAGTGGLSPNGTPQVIVDSVKDGFGEGGFSPTKEADDFVSGEDDNLYTDRDHKKETAVDERTDSPGGAEGNKEATPEAESEKQGELEEEGYDAEGYDRSGYDAEGFDREGYDAEGYDKSGLNKEGYDRSGYDAKGFDREGYDAEGYDKSGLNKEGYDRSGYDAEGFDREGYDAEGYDKSGLNKEGYDRDGYDAEGFDREGYDAEGYDKSGLNKEGYDRSGYDAEGFDREGYDAEGYDKSGLDKEGFDAEGYGKDGYDREGYSRSGYDRFGVHKDYKKKSKEPAAEEAEKTSDSSSDGKPEPPKEPGGPLPGKWEYKFVPQKIILGGSNSGPIDPDSVKNPFTAGKYEWVWVPEKGKSGSPAPNTAGEANPVEDTTSIPEQSGAEPPATPETPSPSDQVATAPEPDSGIIGPEDPMNTLKNHDLGRKDAEVPSDPVISAPDVENDGHLRFPPEESANTATDGNREIPAVDAPEEMTMVDSLGKEHTYVKDPETGKYINILTGGEYNESQWNEWNRNLKENRDWIDEQRRKLETRDTANDRALDEFVENQKIEQKMRENLDKIKKDIMDGKDGTSVLNRGENEPGDVISKIDRVMDEAEKNGKISREDYEKIRRIYQKARNKEIMPEESAYKPSNWETLENLGDMTVKTAKEVMTGADEEGNISVLGIGARILISVATFGGSEYILTPADILMTTKRLVDEGKSNAEIATSFGWEAFKGIVTGKVGQIGGGLVGKGTKKLAEYAAKKLPAQASKLQKITSRLSNELSKERSLIPKAKPAAKPRFSVAKPRPSSQQIRKSLDEIKSGKTKRAGLEINENSFKSTGQKPDLSGLNPKEQIGIKLAAERNQAKIIVRPRSEGAARAIREGKALPKPEKLKIKSVKGSPEDLEFGYSKSDVDKVMLKEPKLPSRAGKSREEWKKTYKEYKKRMKEYKDASVDIEHLVSENPKIKWNKETGEITCDGKYFVGDNDAFAFVDAKTGKPLSPAVNARVNRDLQQYGVTVHKEHVGWDYSKLKESDMVYPSGKTPYQKAEAIDKKILGEDHIKGVSDDKALISFSPDESGNWNADGWDSLNYTGGLRKLSTE